jgi:hypothetical protein
MALPIRPPYPPTEALLVDEIPQKLVAEGQYDRFTGGRFRHEIPALAFG